MRNKNCGSTVQIYLPGVCDLQISQAFAIRKGLHRGFKTWLWVSGTKYEHLAWKTAAPSQDVKSKVCGTRPPLARGCVGDLKRKQAARRVLTGVLGRELSDTHVQLPP